MKRIILANRFGLIALLSLGLFTSTAFAGNSQGEGTTSVVVTNTAAAPVPVTFQKPELYQTFQTVNCSQDWTLFTINVPTGKTLVVRYVNVFAGSDNASDTFGLTLDNGVSARLTFGFQPAPGSFKAFSSQWSLNQQVQLSAAQAINGKLSRTSTDYGLSCEAFVTIAGELM
jgi:hypothetical protein